MTTRRNFLVGLLLGICCSFMIGAAVDKYSAQGGQSAGPIASCFAFSPDDANELTAITRSIWVGTGGDLVLICMDGTQATYRNVPSGIRLSGRFKKVLASGTTASNLVGEY